MVISATTVLFVIEASVRLGKKIYQVALDETVARPICLPPAWVPGYPKYPTAQAFFDKTENRKHLREGGLFHHIIQDTEEGSEERKTRLIEAYVSLHDGEAIWDTVSPENQGDKEAFLGEFYEFKQFMEGEGPRSPYQRIAGTLVEIGIDFFLANPNVLVGDSPARSVLTAVAERLNDTDFSEGSSEDILESLLRAGLGVFESHSDLIIGDKKLQPLIKGISKAMQEDFDKLSRVADIGDTTLDARKAYYRQFASTILRGAGSAIARNPAAWTDDQNTQTLVQATMTNILDGLIEYQDDYFTEKTLEVIVQSSFGTIAEHADLFGNNPILKGILKKTGAALSLTPFEDYGEKTVGNVLAIAVEVIGDNAPQFIHGSNAQLAEKAAEVAATQVAGILRTGELGSLFTAKSAEDMFRAMLLEIAKDPQILIGSASEDSAKSVLVKAVGSLAEAFAQTPTAEMNDRFVKDLIYTSVRIAARNSDKLLGGADLDPGQALLCKSLKAYMEVLFAPDEPRQQWPREVFVEGADKFLEAISTHLEREDDLGAAKTAAQIILAFSRDSLAGKVNGSNFAPILYEVTTEALRGTALAEDEATRSLIEAAA